MSFKNKGKLAAGAAVLLAVGMLTGMSAFAENGSCNDGIYIDGISVGGMSPDQIKAVVNEQVSVKGQKAVTINVGDQQTSVTLNELGLHWENTELVDQVMNLGTRGNIVERYKDQKDLQQSNVNYEITYDLDQDLTVGWAKSLEQYNTEPTNATMYTTDDLTPGVEGGNDGIAVNVEASAKVLEEAIDGWDGSSDLTVDMIVERKEPEITREYLEQVSDVLGQATTDYSASTAGRAVNVQNGCRLISGSLLYPGDTFSVTDHLVPFTPENGYELAGSYEENQVVQSYGGGICQVSTTLYNAVLKAELEVLQRSNHSMVVNYVDLSKDAAIAEGIMDFQFMNNQDTPVYIIGYCYGGQISFMVYGHETRPANRTLEFESRTISTTEPTGSKLVADPNQAVGYVNQTQSPHTGYYAELWKNIYIDGQLSDSVQINSSSYAAVGTIYSVGTKTDSPAVAQAMNTAIASGDVQQVYAVAQNAKTMAQQAQSETQQDQTAAGDAAAGNAAAGDTAGDADDNVVIIN